MLLQYLTQREALFVTEAWLFPWMQCYKLEVLESLVHPLFSFLGLVVDNLALLVLQLQN